MTANRSVTVIMPVYNEATLLAAAVATVDGFLGERPAGAERQLGLQAPADGPRAELAAHVERLADRRRAALLDAALGRAVDGDPRPGDRTDGGTVDRRGRHARHRPPRADPLPPDEGPRA